MKTYLVANAVPNPQGKDALKQYTSNILAMLQAAGGTDLKRIKLARSIYRQSPHSLMLLMVFQDEEAIDSVFESEVYAKLIPFRDQAFSSISIQVFNQD